MDSGTLKLTVVCALGVPAGIWIFFSAFGRLRLQRAIAGTPTSKARSAAMGKCELKGLAREIQEPLKAPLSGFPCVWYRWKVEEEHTDTKGNSHWSTLAEESSIVPFYVEDNSGKLMVHPGGAEIEAPKLLSYTPGLFSSAQAPSGPQAAGWLADSSRRRLSEWRISQSIPVYVLGVLRPERLDPGADPQPVLGAGRQGEPFFIATRSEKELLDELDLSVWGRIFLGAGLAIAGATGVAKLILKF